MSPFSDLWALLLSRALKESFSHWTGPIFSHHCPAVTPKKGASCWQCPVEQGCVSYPTPRSVGASPCRGGFVIAALKESTLSSPLGTACCFLSIAPARTLCPGPSKALLFPSVGSDLWNIFAEGKVIGKQDRMRKVVSHLVLKNILKFLISENRGNPCVLEVRVAEMSSEYCQLTEENAEEFSILLLSSLIITAESVSKGQAFLPSPLFWFKIKKKKQQREEKFLIFTSGFGFVVLCVDAVEHKAGGCSWDLWNQSRAHWAHCPGTTPPRAGRSVAPSQARVQARHPRHVAAPSCLLSISSPDFFLNPQETKQQQKSNLARSSNVNTHQIFM